LTILFSVPASEACARPHNIYLKWRLLRFWVLGGGILMTHGGGKVIDFNSWERIYHDQIFFRSSLYCSIVISASRSISLINGLDRS